MTIKTIEFRLLCLTIVLEILFYHLHLHFGCNDDDGYHFNTLIVHLFVRFTTVKSLYLLINMMIIHLRRFNFMYNGEVAFPQSVISQVCILFLSSIAVQYVYLSSKHFPYESLHKKINLKWKAKINSTQSSQHTVRPCDFFSAVRYLLIPA